MKLVNNKGKRICHITIIILINMLYNISVFNNNYYREYTYQYIICTYITLLLLGRNNNLQLFAFECNLIANTIFYVITGFITDAYYIEKFPLVYRKNCVYSGLISDSDGKFSLEERCSFSLPTGELFLYSVPFLILSARYIHNRNKNIQSK